MVKRVYILQDIYKGGVLFRSAVLTTPIIIYNNWVVAKNRFTGQDRSKEEFDIHLMVIR